MTKLKAISSCMRTTEPWKCKIQEKHLQLANQSNTLDWLHSRLPSCVILAVLKITEQLGAQRLLRRHALLHGLPHHHGLLLLLKVVHSDDL
jgi:hypothetical protein